MRGAKDMQDKMFRDIDSKQREMVRSLIEMCRIPAYHPSSGGDGEAEKSRHLEGLVKEMGLKCKAYNAPDKTVSAGYRPNLMVYADRMPAKGKGALWLVAHTDVVPPGDLTAWTRPPFEPYEKGGKVFGRGVEDNGQAVISALYALQAVARACPGTNAGVALVADEETGSGKGIQYLISKELFDRNDQSIIPDWGTDTGDSIEVAEKSMLWLRFTTEGRQVHASVPHTGINAFRAASKLLSGLDERLHERFGSTNELFQPPFSTFEPTKKESNVPNVNTVPGKDVFYFDCRVLPEYSLDDVVSIVKDQVSAIEREMNVKVTIDATLRETSPQTSEKSEIVRKLTGALKELRGLEAKPIGIGGGTCAAFFRKMGMDVAVWQTCDGMAHTVDECTRVKYLTEDAKVFAHVMTQSAER